MSKIIIESQTQFYDEVAHGSVVVLFTQPATCVPCRQFAPHFDRASTEATEIKFLYVDLDDNPWAMLHFTIKSVPTVKLFFDGGYLRDIKAPQGALPFINELRS